MDTELEKNHTVKFWKSIILIIWVAIQTSTFVKAQNIQQELAASAQRLSLQYQWIDKPIPNTPIELTGLGFLGKFYDSNDAKFDEAVVQTAVLWEVPFGLKVGADLFYSNHAGLQPGIMIQHSFQLSSWNVLVNPTLAYANRTGTVAGKAILIIEKDFRINNGWQLGLTSLATTSFNEFQTHDRSLAQVRVGPTFNNQLQLGIGYDYDGYGPDVITKNQINIFIRKKFNH